MIELIAVCLVLITIVLIAFYFKSYPVDTKNLKEKVSSTAEEIARPKPRVFERYTDLQRFVYDNLDCELKHSNSMVGRVSYVYSEKENLEQALLTGDAEPIKLVRVKLLTDQGIVDVEVFIPKLNANIQINDIVIVIPQKIPTNRIVGGDSDLKLKDRFMYISSGSIEPVFYGKKYGWKAKEVFINL